MESQLGMGATFHFTVPYESAAGSPEPRPSFVGPPGTRILVVEANPVMRGLIGKWCVDWGIDATIYADTDEFMATARLPLCGPGARRRSL